ncbi:MAG: Asp-tRNA(Asn)/Glu-tRNA(Gln) amidotransferase subunit GatC [Caldicoprobacter sp.]|jgi:aspartyl/glutamyl-tRNA(Asn/Gln) amidotransferase, C subunit|uniref:Asp-tRNA(Asn)/Glu-tRNA(Gln) amidotransferase subunit GatC n=1 Tax=Caldicoprobacter sp. TaxID=2004500 RepID=UPI0039C2B5B7
MAITKEVIKYIAMLARLQLNEEEESSMVSDINRIISYFDKLKELDTSNIDAMEFLSMDEDAFEKALRDDVVDKSYDREELLHPEEEKGSEYFTVPRVVE